MSAAPSESRHERFTNQQRFVATAEHMKQKFGLDGKGFFCGLCGHRFVEGDGVRWVYANGNSPSYCNFFTCDSCDGPDVLERRTAAGNLAKSLEFNEIVLAAKFLRAERDIREQCAQLLKEEAGEIGTYVAYHIEEMYPGAFKATPKSFLLSVRNFTSNKIAALAERVLGKGAQ